MHRKLPIAVVVVLLAAGTLSVVWSGLNWPPPLWILKYGLRSGCEPTGEVVEIEDIEFVMIGPGCFRMGSDAWNCAPGDLLGRLRVPGPESSWGVLPQTGGSMPVHWVEFRRGFGVARMEVTNADFHRFDPGFFHGSGPQEDSCPVVNVSREQAEAYCAWLSGRSGRRVRLPTEAEWECACRAGTETEYCFGDGEEGLGEYAWNLENCAGREQPVGTKRGNAWGLCDLHGNVSEWVADPWHDSYLLIAPAGPRGGPTGGRILARAPDDGTAWTRDSALPYPTSRGGNQLSSAWLCASAARGLFSRPRFRNGLTGFRPALEPSDP